MGKFVFNHLTDKHNAIAGSNRMEQWTGNFFVLCLMGSLFVQPKPTLIMMVVGALMLLWILATGSGRSAISLAFTKQSYLITTALLLWFLVHLLMVLVHPPLAWRQLGNYARAVVAIGVFVFILKSKPQENYFFIGVAIACVGAFAHALYDRYVDKHLRAIGWFNNDIHFGDYSSLAGVFAILIGVLASHVKTSWRIGLVCLGALGVAAAAISGTRSALLALVCLLPIALSQHRDLTQKYFRWALIAAIFGSSLLVATSASLRQQMRITEAIWDVKMILSGKAQTSIADRLEMWKASINMAKRAPILGIGMANYEADLQHQIDTQQIRPLLTKQNQAHSQIFHSLATGGAVLLIAYLAFIFVPFFWFWQIYRRYSSDSQMRLLAHLGIAHIGAHFIFGLTAAIFDIQVFASFYVLGLACFAAMCRNRATLIEHGLEHEHLANIKY